MSYQFWFDAQTKMRQTLVTLAFSLWLQAFVTAAEFPVERSTIAQRADGTINYRLPLNLKPVNYDVTLEPFFDPTFTFDGNLVLHAVVVETGRNVYLHGAELTFQRENIAVFDSDRNYTVDELSYDSITEIYTIALNDSLEANASVWVEIEYTGRLNENNRGFYRANYVNEEGVTRWLGTTQFEPTSARRAFPCLDEPGIQATFTIRIRRTSDYHSISNMLRNYTTDLGDGRFQDNFEESILMPTYLVAFIVSDYYSVSNGSHSVFARKQLIEDGRGVYGLYAGMEILEIMENYTTLNYSLNKMYQVAIPDGWFQAGAMENWGLVTYRERYLLYKDTVSTALDKQLVATIISHEYAHQWYGNLVSPSWWNYIWLNEGFATYYEYQATSVFDPSMRLMEQFVVRPHQNAFASDALETSRPMTFDAGSPQEISNLFDRIAYDKSGAVIRMMENFLTNDIFKRGLTLYLLSREYDAATADDLWAGLQEALDESGRNYLLDNMTVREIMETWNSQAGYPVVTVRRNAGGIVSFSQDRFLINNATHGLNETWIIPINYATRDNADFGNTSITYWLKTRESGNTDVIVDPNSWMIVNKQEMGYYRVNYDESNWQLIIDHLNDATLSTIPATNRAQLLDDAFNLARSGRLGYDILFDLLGYLSRETDYIPLFSFFRGLTYLDLVFSESKTYELFQVYVQDLLQQAYESVGTDDRESDTHTDKLNRIQVLNWACRMNHSDCQEKLHDRLVAGEHATPDMQSPVYCNGMQLNRQVDTKWNNLYALYWSGETEELQKSRVLAGMACTRSPEQIRRLLDIIVGLRSNETIRVEDRATFLSALYGSSQLALQTTLDYLIENFDEFRSALPNAGSSTLTGISNRLTTLEQRDRFEELVSKFNSSFASAVSTSRRNIEENLNWNEQYGGAIGFWLITKYGTTTSDSTSTPSTSTAIDSTICDDCESSPDESPDEPHPSEPPPDDDDNALTYKSFVVLTLGCLVTILVL